MKTAQQRHIILYKQKICVVFNKMNKKGIEVSMGFIVTMIIVITAFGFGLVLIFKFADQKDELAGSISEDSKRSITQMLEVRGDRVAIPFQTIEVQKGKTAFLNIGVMNVLSDRDYKVSVSSKMIDQNNGRYIATGGTAFKSCGTQCIVFTNAGAVKDGPDYYKIAEVKTTIKEKASNVFTFPIVTKNAEKGTYNLEVDVSYDGESGFTEYDVTHTVKVVVN